VTLIVTRETRADTLTLEGYIVALPDTLDVESDGSGDYPTIRRPWTQRSTGW